MKVFMYGLLAVGMRHYGSSELKVGEVYYLRRDIDNPYDGNAVAIVDQFWPQESQFETRRGCGGGRSL